jgi:dihydroorotase-like cyclic amidohydrolase
VQAFVGQPGRDRLFCTDLAPHTLTERTAPPPARFPRAGNLLPLLLTPSTEGRLALEDIVLRCHTNTRRIFTCGAAGYLVEGDEDAAVPSTLREPTTRCGWTPLKVCRCAAGSSAWFCAVKPPVKKAG